jgi:general secretion pathway protein L
MATTPETFNARPTPAWRQSLQSFWRWWTGELAQAMPERLAAFGGVARVPHLAVEGDEVVMVEPQLTQGAQARMSLAGDATRAASAVAMLLARGGETRRRARLALAHREVLLRRTTMPAATEENLGQVIGFEMDRLTPFRAEDVYFDYKVLSRDTAAGTLSVLLAVSRRDLVDARLARLRELGVSVQGIAVHGDATAAGLDLLPHEQRGERENRSERTLRFVLIALVAALLVAVLAYPVWRKREEVKAILPVAAQAEAQAKSADALRAELERQVTDYNFLLARKHGTPPPLAYLEDVSRLLPDSTWLAQFDLKNTGKSREVLLSGETASASKLIEILEQSRLIANAAPRGSITKGSMPNTERFQIAAEAKGRPAPEPLPLAEMPASPAAPKPAPAAPAASVTPVPAAPAPVTPPAPAKVEPVKPRPAPVK